MAYQKSIWFGILLIIAIFFPYDVEAQCAMCRASVESNMLADGRQVGAGLNQGILYLMVMPYIILSILGYLWYQNSKKERTRKQYQIVVEN